MEEKAYNPEIMVRYLLGLLPIFEQERFEADFFADEQLLEELGALEEELIDEYLTGQLSQPYRDAFESHFLRSPEHRRKLNFAISLKSYLENTQATKSSNIQDPAHVWWRSLISFLRKRFLAFL